MGVPKQARIYLIVPRGDNYERVDGCNLRRQGNISPKFGAWHHMAGAVAIPQYGEDKKADSSSQET